MGPTYYFVIYYHKGVTEAGWHIFGKIYEKEEDARQEYEKAIELYREVKICETIYG